MNKKIFVLALAIALLALTVPLINAQDEPETVTVWTDKPEYTPGETGTLNIVYYNGLDSAVTIEKIFVIFEEWRAYEDGEWKGNQTITVNQAIVSGGTYSTSVTFTVPTDGRAKTTDVQIVIRTTEAGDINWPVYPEVFHINVAQTVKYMEQIITLFTIQVVLLIVCTIIIAATIFLSARRPRITWKAEEKVEQA